MKRFLRKVIEVIGLFFGALGMITCWPLAVSMLVAGWLYDDDYGAVTVGVIIGSVLLFVWLMFVGVTLSSLLGGQ